jgi:hypothetical protein
VAGTHQDTAVLGHDRKDMTGLHDIFGSRIPRHRSLDGQRTVLGRDARRDPFSGFDGNREGRTVRALVVARHLRQTQLPAARLGQRQTDEAAAKPGHEVDRLGSHMLGGKDQIALVLAIFLVHQDNHASGPHFNNDLFNRRDIGRRALWCHL